MDNFRCYGPPPYRLAVIHGGPGAAGEMASVARELAHDQGVLEPLQTTASVEGQIAELHACLEKNAQLPATLVGYSWGAWLSLLTAASHPQSVRKIILVSSGGFSADAGLATHTCRMQRLAHGPKKRLASLQTVLDNPSASPSEKAAAFSEIGELFGAVDAFDPLADSEEPLNFDPGIYNRVWPEADRWRSQGRLLEAARRIHCPVIAIHGDYDPHPAETVRAPLAEIIPDFQFHLISKCGHTPWRERYGREPFFRLLENILRNH